MKLMLWLLALSGYAIKVQCSLNTIVANPGGIGGIYQGPNSETIIKGPDGSLITSQETGGSIHTDSKLEPIIVAEPEITASYAPDFAPEISSASLAPVLSPSIAAATLAPPLEPVISATVAPITASIAPVIASVNPLAEPHVVEIIEQDPHIIETEIVDTPVIEPQLSSDLVGPSGSISTRGSSSIISGPASTTISEPAKVLIAAPVLPAIPVISSITTRLHATPYVEVNNEEPLKSVSRATVSAGVSLVLSTIAPIGIGAVSTLGPPIITNSASLGDALRNTAINIASTLAPPVGDGNIGINLVSTLAPPLSDLGNIRGYIDSSSASPILRGYNPVISSTTTSPIVRDSTGYNRVLVTSTSPAVFNEGNNIVQPASSYGFIGNAPTAGQVSSSPSPAVTYSSTIRPPPISGYEVPYSGDVHVPDENIQSLDEAPGSSYGIIGNLPPAGQISSTPSPGVIYASTIPSSPAYSYDVSPPGDVGVSDGNIQRLDEAPVNNRQFSGNNIVQPASSYGFIGNVPPADQTFSTPSPGVTYSSTLPPSPTGDIRVSDGNIQRLDEALANNRQFTINPSSIPPQNIIPPEIGRLPPLPEGPVDLGTTFQGSSVPRAPGLVSSNPLTNVQRIDNANSGFNDNSYQNIDGRLQGDTDRQLISSGGEENLQNEIPLTDYGRESGRVVYQQSVGFGSTGPLLRNTNPIINGRDSQRPVDLQWERSGLDSSQFQQSNTPLAPDSRRLIDGRDSQRPVELQWERSGIDSSQFQQSNTPLAPDSRRPIDGRDLQRPVELQWERSGIDSSQFRQSNTPLAPDSRGLPLRPGDFDDRNSASLWNRYGRRTRYGKW